MFDDLPSGESTNGSLESREQISTDVLELRLPSKLEFLPLVRAAAGVIAGGMSFRYYEIVQLRTAAAEAFELSVRYAERNPNNLIMRFTITPDSLEILILAPEETGGTINPQELIESEALLGSLMDEVELNTGEHGSPSIRLLKYKPQAEG